MERQLANLFDFQRFSRNPRLAGILGDVESRYGSALDDDDLDLVSAAGDTVKIIMHDLQPEDFIHGDS